MVILNLYKRLSKPLKALVLSVAAIFLLLVVYLLFFRSGKKEVAEPYPIVSVEPVEAKDVDIYGEYVGRINAQQYVEVRARVEGYLQKILFKEGSYVQKGQTLFIIDPTIYSAKVTRAAAQLNKAKANAVKAKRDLDRIRPLFEANAASQLDLDNAVAAYEGAVV